VAIQRPYNINIRGTTIDTMESNTIKWSVSGSVQTSFSIKIYKNSDNSLVYDVPETNSFTPEYTIPPNSLQNGLEYKINVTVYDEGNFSATSDSEIFQTSGRPVVSAQTIGTVRNSSYNFQADYIQTENVGLKSYIVFLYDSNLNLVSKSDMMTTTPLEHMFTGLISEKDYYVEFQATSNKGLTGTSGKIKFDVLYTQPVVNVNLQASNVENAGIELSWNVIQIIMKTSGTTAFIDNEKLDVQNGKVYADEGFSLDKDFTLQIWIEKPENKQDLMILKGSNGQYVLQYHAVDERFHLYKISKNNIQTSWMTQQVTGDTHHVTIRQIGMNTDVISPSPIVDGGTFEELYILANVDGGNMTDSYSTTVDGGSL
jgi:hypothetical protein